MMGGSGRARARAQLLPLVLLFPAFVAAEIIFEERFEGETCVLWRCSVEDSFTCSCVVCVCVPVCEPSSAEVSCVYLEIGDPAC